MWTAIVLTCPQKSWCSALETELQKIIKYRNIRTEEVLVVPDPGDDHGGGVGSGGATLNALLVATEHLSARAGHTTVVSDLLFTARHSQSWLASRRGDDNNNTTQHQTNSRNEGLTVTLYLPGGCFIKSF